MNRALLLALIAAQESGTYNEFSPFYEAYYKYLYNFILKMVYDREAAHELTQESFTRILGAWDRTKTEQERKNYLFTVAANICRDRARSKKHRNQVPLELIEGTLESDRNQEAERRTELQHFEEILETVVRELPEEERMILHMKRMERMSYEDISRITGKSVRTLKRRVKETLDAIVAEMERRGIVSGEVLA